MGQVMWHLLLLSLNVVNPNVIDFNKLYQIPRRHLSSIKNTIYDIILFIANNNSVKYFELFIMKNELVSVLTYFGWVWSSSSINFSIFVYTAGKLPQIPPNDKIPTCIPLQTRGPPESPWNKSNTEFLTLILVN